MRPGSNARRLRGRGNGRKHPSGGRNQTFESNGPDVKVRGSAQQVVEKYLALARDASSAGDRVMAENYFQHAEHYLRVLNSIGGTFEPRGEFQGNGGLNENGGRDDDEQPMIPHGHQPMADHRGDGQRPVGPKPEQNPA